MINSNVKTAYLRQQTQQLSNESSQLQQGGGGLPCSVMRMTHYDRQGGLSSSDVPNWSQQVVLTDDGIKAESISTENFPHPSSLFFLCTKRYFMEEIMEFSFFGVFIFFVVFIFSEFSFFQHLLSSKNELQGRIYVFCALWVGSYRL